MSNFPINEGEEPREFLDLDKMFELMLDFYKRTREKTLKSLNEHIVKKTSAVEAVLEIDDFLDIFRNFYFGEVTSPDTFVSFPDKVSLIRAYIFASTTGRTNMNDIASDNFTSAITRFGLENPLPSITARLSLYGTNELSIKLLKNETLDKTTLRNYVMHKPVEKKLQRAKNTKSYYPDPVADEIIEIETE